MGAPDPLPGAGIGSACRPVDCPILEPDWLPPPPDLVLASGDVHLWRDTLDRPSGASGGAWRVLSEEERTRAARISLDRERGRFIAGRCILRSILGRYLGLAEDGVRLAYGPHGKPELAPGLSALPLTFSLAHSQDCILVAVTVRRAIGVDVEFLRPLSDLPGLVARVFSAPEQAEWHALPAELRLEGFFRGWTGKEAWLKAKSTGLTWPPDFFSVSLTPGTPLRLLDVKDDANAPGQWSLASFTAAPGCLGALAVEGCRWNMASFDNSLAFPAGP